MMRRLLGKIIKVLILFVMSNHTYRVGKKKYKQKIGAPIGLQISGTLAEITMVVWDRTFIILIKSSRWSLIMYKRYVDDVDLAYLAGKGETREERIEQIGQIVQLANSIMEMIIMEEDTVYKNEDGRVPILDL